MKTIILDKPGKISKEIQRVKVLQIINQQERIIKHLNIEDFDVIIINNPSVSITSGVIKLIKNKEIVFMEGNECIAKIIGIERKPIFDVYTTLLIKIKESKYKSRRLAFVFAYGVSINKIKLLRKLNQRRKNSSISTLIKKMKQKCSTLRQAKSIDNIRNIEAQIAREYYKALSYIVKGYNGKRDKKAYDPFNVLLNLTRSMLRNKIHKILLKEQINTSIGFLHTQKGKNKPFLSYDFTELFLHYADAFSIYCINRNIIKDKDISIEGKLKQNKLKYIFEKYNLKDTNIKIKIDQFINYIENKGSFNWVINREK